MADMIKIELPADIDAVRRRFEAMVTKEPSGCWIWTGSRDYRGYGRFRWNTPRSVLRAHRAAYALYVAVPDTAAVVCHRCDNPACVNPEHLFLGTFRDNTRDMFAKDRWVKPRPPRGERNANSHLTEDDVRAIRADKRTYEQIGADYRMSKGGISHIKSRRVWTHI
ncbi:MAG: HNH endonuclease signature motif containing protein [Hyphomicrobiales bacterium]|nr:HNH endonuclease signature motif containing protein [Hyphomicrobiales bacterium]